VGHWIRRPAIDGSGRGGPGGRGSAGAAVDAFIDVVTDALSSGEDVQFNGFGKFYVQARDAREGINPQTKAKIQIAATNVPKFSAGSALKSAVR